MENVFLRKRQGLPAGRQGFTLIEILIVIAILGTLATLGLASYTATLKNGRDARRRSDLKAMQNAWEQYYADSSAKYPSDCDQDMSIYLPAGLPKDPTNSETYTYVLSNCTTTTYTFCANLESGPQYCVNNLQ